MNKGLVALDIDHHVVVATHLAEGFVAAVGATLVVGRGHHHLATEGLDSGVYTLVIGSHHGIVQNACDLLVDTLNNGFTTEYRQRLARKARRCITRGNYCDKFHIFYSQL